MATEESRKALLDNLSQQKCVDLIPMHMYVAVMMIAGLIGNILVCRFYTTRGRATPTTRLIVAVAIIDTIVCVFMPKNIAIMCLSFNGYGYWPCKLNVYFNHVTGVYSVFVLVAIAIFRFRAVCRPFARQFTLRHTNIVIMSLFLLSMVLSLPILFTYEMTALDVKLNANVTAIGYNCQSSKDPSQKVLIFTFNGVIFFLFLISLLIIFAMYSLIGISIIKMHRKRIRLFASPVRESANGISMSETSTYPNESSNVVAEKSVCENEVAIHTEKPTYIDAFDCRDVKNYSDNAATEDGPNEPSEESLADKKGEHDNVTATSMKDSSAEPVASLLKFETEKMQQMDSTVSSMNNTSAIPAAVIRQVLMLFIITLILIISSLPYLATSISEAISGFSDEDKYTNWYQFCQRSYLINSATNPFVYGFFNTEFRHFVKNRCLCRKYN